MTPTLPRKIAVLLLLTPFSLGSGAVAQIGNIGASRAPAVSGSASRGMPGRLVELAEADAPAPSTAVPPPPASAKPKSDAKTPGTQATVVNLKTIEGVMGKSVKSRAANEDMGRIVDVLVDGGGQIRAAVIDFGGFLGVGSRKVAVAWKTLDFTDSIQSGSVKATLTRDQVRQSPEYKPDEPIVILEGTAPSKPAVSPPSPGHNQDAPAR